MSFATRLLSPMDRRADMDPMDERAWPGYAPMSLTGMPVTPESAMKLSACWACVRLIANSLASIPLITYKRRGAEARDRAPNMPLYSLLHDRPNRYMTAFAFKQLMMVHLLTQGNGYAYIRPGPRGPIDHLDPIHPCLVSDPLLTADGGLAYPIKQADGTTRLFMDDEIFHLVGLSFDGIKGVSVIEYARESMGLALATESYGARYFSQNAVPTVVIKHPGKPSGDARRRIRDEWEADTSGLANAHRAAVVAEGITVEKLAMSNDDSQFLQLREFQIADIARWYGVPLHMIQEVSGSTSWGSGLEQMGQGFVTFTLLPWAMLWEQTISRDLILAEGSYFSEFLFDALVRADFKTRYETYHIALSDKIMSRNEVRQRENMNPVDGGDFGDLQPAGNGQAGGTGQTGAATDEGLDPHYGRLLRDAAERVIRKEAAVLGKAFARLEDWREWPKIVEAFCDSHVGYVAKTLCIDFEAAAGYYVNDLQAQLSVPDCTEALIRDADGRRLVALVQLVLAEDVRSPADRRRREIIQGLNGESDAGD